MAVMQIVSLLVGAAIGYLAGVKLIPHVLLLFFHRNFLGGDKYLSLYDRLDHESIFELLQGFDNPPKSYADFLRIHQELREDVLKEFKRYTRDVTKYVIIGYSLIVLVGLLFLGYWQWYLAGFIVAHIAVLLINTAVRKHNSEFYISLMVFTLLSVKDR